MSERTPKEPPERADEEAPELLAEQPDPPGDLPPPEDEADRVKGGIVAPCDRSIR